MIARATVNNVELVVEIDPNPLGGRPGAHRLWFNNNNPWIATVTATTVEVRDPASAELDLLVNGNRVRRRAVRVGNVGRWASSNPVDTTMEQVPGATSAGEMVDLTCRVSRAQMAPNLPPPALHALGVSVLVSF